MCFSFLTIWLVDKQDDYFNSGMNPTDPGLEGQEFIDILKSTR